MQRCRMYFEHVDCLTSGIEARQRLTVQNYDCVMIVTPLGNEFGDMLARYAANDPFCLVVLWVRNEMSEEIAQTMENVYVRGIVFDMDEWETMMRFLDVTSCRINVIRSQNDDLMKKISEIRLVDQAKCLLIEKYHYSEEKAHHMIEKKAMDNRMSRAQVAKIVIRHIKDKEEKI